MNNKIYGYKIFNLNHCNRYGMKFKENTLYQTSEFIQFGNLGHGFHMCTNIEDCFRYIDTSAGFSIASVVGSGHKQRVDDEYYGYYNMYVVSKLYINKFIDRKTIFNIVVNSSKESVLRMIMTCTLNDKEIHTLIVKYIDNIEVLKYILYYQYNVKDIFKEKDNTVKKLFIKNKR